jgi:hypothetical protein
MGMEPSRTTHFVVGGLLGALRTAHDGISGPLSGLKGCQVALCTCPTGLSVNRENAWPGVFPIYRYFGGVGEGWNWLRGLKMAPFKVLKQGVSLFVHSGARVVGRPALYLIIYISVRAVSKMGVSLKASLQIAWFLCGSTWFLQGRLTWKLSPR